ncbi:MAG: zeta toxin family protein [Xanthobacteraceae bacterium]|jgi:predicted ABC-type ATPase
MTAETAPLVVVVAGANGAGKSTAAPSLLRDSFRVTEFINADTIAAGLSAFRPASVAIAAGRIMLERMRHLAVSRKNFAFETTLASRTLAPWPAAWKRDGYHVHLLFLWLKSAELAVTRVAERVRLGGHDVPAEVVRRRYAAGSQNLFQLYMPLIDSWQMFDNSEGPHPVPIAAGDRHSVRNIITDVETWRRLEGSFGR